jgi:hypothetical protein
MVLFFEYYKLEINDKIEKFGVLVKEKGSINSGNTFVMDKGLGLIELGNSTAGSVNLISDLYLTNDTEIAQVVCEKNEIQIVKTVGENNGKEIIIPYGTDLTNLESRLTSLENRSGGSSTFRQSIIDNATIYNPNNIPKDIITSNQDFSTIIKILVGESVKPNLAFSR